MPSAAAPLLTSTLDEVNGPPAALPSGKGPTVTTEWVSRRTPVWKREKSVVQTGNRKYDSSGIQPVGKSLY